MTILIVDDHPIFLKGLVEVIQTSYPDAKLIAKTKPCEVIDIELKKIDIAVLDLDMPDYNGFELGEILKSKFKDLKIIILTMHKEPETIKFAINKGFDGYVFKDDAVFDVIDAIEKIKKGLTFFPDKFLSDFTDEVFDFKNVLSKQEYLILELIAHNKTSKEISEKMFLSCRTIENHRNNISRKLQLKGSNSLLKFAVSNKNFFFNQKQ